MQKHLNILGWLQIALGVIDVLIGLAVFGLFSGIGVLSGDAASFGMMAAIGGFVGTLSVILAIPNFIVGIGLLQRWGDWVLWLAAILGFFNLVKFPWGTAIGIYTFWITWSVLEERQV